MKQVTLYQGQTLLTTWVDRHNEIKQGSVVTLKDREGKWRVHRIYDVEVLEKSLDTHRFFDNNNYDKHEGLFKSCR